MEKDLKYGECYCYCHGDINGISIDTDDFGEKYDRNPEDADDYCCGNMQFTRYEGTDFKINRIKSMKKYNITSDEYDKICTELEDKLSFGSCGWCS